MLPKFGSSEQEKELLVKTATSLENAGSELLILELVNSITSKQITEVLKIPTVGIGSGKFVDGQVLVLYDILGIGKKLSFAKDFLSESNSIEECIKNYIQSVKKGTFPEKLSFFTVSRTIKEAATNIKIPPANS